jgi:hypothetical protein
MEWTRDNHLGNGRNGQMTSFNWTLPKFQDLIDSNHIATFGTLNNYMKCVFRLRYNLSTEDYDPWNTTSDSNQNQNRGIKSPVTQNPTVDVGTQSLQGLALAINTNQFGRTFQDRSHVFYLKRRPATMPALGNKIINLNVRGKRGNIVQTYPAMEYDFIPNIVHVTAANNDLLHIQWTGSNTHNNGDPAGDGQAGDAGEGTGGTDRHNIVQSGDSDSNYPLPLDKYPTEALFSATSANSACFDFDGTALGTNINCALRLATSGQFLTAAEANSAFDPLLNNAPASLIGGVLVRPIRQGTYNYIDTRNNNFSNRSTKAAINVD